jgi:class I fructose-bisphosphate aldolase
MAYNVSTATAPALATAAASELQGAILPRPRYEHLSIGLGKRVRLWRLLYAHGPANGTLLILPLDQGLEHGPADFWPNPAALDTSFQFRLALEGRYSAIALGIGLAEKYMKDYCGRVPLILKLNGKTNIPDDGDAVSPLSASVEDAVRLGADAVGYTLYVGTPRQDAEFLQFMKVRQDCERLGMPIVMWAYPRGRAIDARGGKGSLYAIDYAARLAEEVGADVVKLHEPGESLVLFSGGSKLGRDEALAKIDLYMRSGAAGIIFGRNLWQRPYDDALALSRDAHEILQRYSA